MKNMLSWEGFSELRELSGSTSDWIGHYRCGSCAGLNELGVRQTILVVTDLLNTPTAAERATMVRLAKGKARGRAAITSTTEFNPAKLAADRAPNLRGFFNLDPALFEDVISINIIGTMAPSQIFGSQMAAKLKTAVA